jgi:hypothetical protein
MKFALRVEMGDLQKRLLDLEPKTRKKVMRPALKKGAAVVLPAILRRTPLGMTSRLISSISVRPGSAKGTRKGLLSTTISTTRDDSSFGGRMFYGAFQEFGWMPGRRIGRSSRWQVRTDRWAGRVPGKHYMEAGFDERAAQARDVILAALKAGLDRIAEGK